MSLTLSDFCQAANNINPMTGANDIGLVIVEDISAATKLKKELNERGFSIVTVIDKSDIECLSYKQAEHKEVTIVIALGGREAEVFDKLGSAIGPVYRYGAKNG